MLGSDISIGVLSTAVLAVVLAQGTVVVEMRSQLSSLQFLATFVSAVNIDIATTPTRGVDQMCTAVLQQPNPVAALVTICAADLKLVDFSLNGFVYDVGKVLLSAVGAHLAALGPQPLQQAGLTEVLPTAGREVGIAEDFGADRRTDVLFRYLFDEAVFVISATLPGRLH